MLTKLTKTQEKKLSVYRDKWLKIGLDTKPADRKKAEKAAIAAYKVAGLEPPKIFIWMNSPLEGAFAAAYLIALKKDDKNFSKVLGQVWAQVWAQVWDQVGAQVLGQVRDQVWDQVAGQVAGQVADQVRDQVRDQVWDQVRDQVADQVRDQVRAQVRDQVRDQVRAQVWAQVWDQVGAQVLDQVWDQVGAQVLGQVRDQVWDQVGAQVLGQVAGQVADQVWDQVYNCGYGSHDAGWLSYYSYLLESTKLKCCEKLKPLMDLAQHSGWWWPFTGVVIFSEKPEEIHMTNGRLHKDGGPAIRYRDGFSLYRLNGIRVPKEVAEIKSEDITKEMILKEQNADIRREVIRKVEMERLSQLLDYKVIDSYDGYELITFDIGDGRVRPYLKMQNPSIKVDHIEGVSPETKTVKEAIMYRNSLSVYEKPAALS